MIKVVAKNYIKEDKIDAFIEVATQLVKLTREKDAGCIRYELVQDVKDPLILTMLEEWEDQESLAAHGSSAHFKEAIGAMKEMVEKPGDSNFYKTLI
jgi:quinol monooxygenase YgiN